MTAYTKVTDNNTSYIPSESYGFLYDSLDVYDDPSRMYDGGVLTPFTETADISTSYIPTGLLMYLGTEGDDLLMAEDDITYLLISNYGSWTKVSDTSTSYIKVADV